MTTTVRLSVPLGRAHEALRSAFGDYRPLLDELGATLTHHSQDAFQRQAFGEYQWPARYWGRGAPFVNVAGALADLASGPNVAGNRFDKRPALQDRGSLQSTITWNVLGRNEVQYGSPRDYAPDHQKGATRSIPIGAGIRYNLQRWLKRGDNAKYRSRLGFAFVQDDYTFQLIKRPFIGVTDEGQRDLLAATESYIADAVRGLG